MAKSKISAIIIAILLMTSIGTTLAIIPTTSATETIVTYAYIQAAPNPVSVGETEYIYMWLDKVISNSLPTNDIRFHDYKLDIIAPDGTKETITFSEITDTTSNQGYSFAPDQIGTYNLTFTFPGQTYTWDGTYKDYYYLPSTASTTLAVQEDATYKYPDSYALPTEYWTRPIYGENPYWYTISSNWLGTGAPAYSLSTGNGQIYPDDAVGSLTNHIMWTKSLQSGGVVGGDNFEIYGNTYYDGSAYYVRYLNPIIVNGYLYYTEPLSYSEGIGGDTVCVDLRTGEEIWRNPDITSLSFALLFDIENGNQHGVYNALLISTGATGVTSLSSAVSTWYVYDADTGTYLYNVTDIPTGTKAAGPNNEYLIYTTTNTAQGYMLSMWNSTKLYTQSHFGTAAISETVNASTSDRYEWTYPITYKNQNWTTSFTVLATYYNDFMLCYNGTMPTSTVLNSEYTYFLVNLNEDKGDIGDVLWMNTIDSDLNATVNWSGLDLTNRVFVEGIREKIYWIGYDLTTGDELWTTEDYPQTALDYYGSQASGKLSNSFYDGKMYSSAYAGIVYCYDTTDGSIVWTYGNGGEGNSTNSGFEVPGNYPTFINGYGDGVVYTVTSEHTIETPIYKGALARALNATTGEEIWTLSSYNNEFGLNCYALADGYNTWFNGYDNQIYVVGKGTSHITVNAPSASIELGSSLVIDGKVTDTSAGANQDEVALRFPDGLPVSSDDSMKDWMGYVYQDKPVPSNFTGVDVTITVIDANGNYRVIGTATTDASGFYSLQWTPDISGKYTVITSFAGTNGYWPSYAENAFAVDELSVTSTPQTTQEPSAADLYFIPATAGLFVAIIVVIALVALVLKKHP
jgi:hypothetical protein